MAAVSTIVLADAQATPVNHSFIPLGPDANGVWWFEDQTGSSTLGYPRISLKLTRAPQASNGTASSSNRVNRVKMTIYLPTLETLGTNDAGVTPPPTVAYVERMNEEFILSERDTLQNRKDLLKYSKFLHDNAQVVGMVETLQNIY